MNEPTITIPIRDFFAALAMQKLLEGKWGGAANETLAEVNLAKARLAYQLADAMMEVRDE